MEKRVFVGSSTESLPAAKAIHSILGDEFRITVWDRLFKAGEITIDALIDKSREFEYAIFLYTPDDIAYLRKKRVSTVRDNVVFETGIFMSTLGRDRVFVLNPRLRNLRILSDLDGYNRESFVPPSMPITLSDWVAKLTPACVRLREQMNAPVSPSDKRAIKAVPGSWRGVVKQPTENPSAPAEEFNCSAAFSVAGESVHGEIKIEGDLGSGIKEAKLKLIGYAVHDEFLKFDYNYVDLLGALQFGTVILKLDSIGQSLSGRYCGFGPFRNKIVNGELSLERLATPQP